MSLISRRLLPFAFFTVSLTAGPLSAQTTGPLYFEQNAEILSAHFDAQDNLVITAAANGIINLWDPDTGRLIRSFGGASRLSKKFLADFSPNGKLVASANERGGKVWNTKFGDVVCSLTGYGDTIKSIHFSADSKWLIAASLDGTAKLWNVQTGKRHHSLNHMVESLGKKEKHTGVTDAQFCNLGKSIVTGSGKLISTVLTLDSISESGDTTTTQKNTERYDSAVLVWDIITGKVTHAMTGYPFDVSPDGGRLVTGSVNVAGQTAKVWDLATGKLIYILSGHSAEVTECQFSKNGKLILTASAVDSTCRVWEAASGKFVCYLKASLSTTNNSAQLSPDGKWISTYSQDTVRVWNIGSGKLLHSIAASHPIVFSKDSRSIVVLDSTRASVYATVSGKPVMAERKPVGPGTKKVLKIR